MTSINIPSYLSEVNPEEHAFILLKRTRTTKKRKQSRVRPFLKTPDLRQTITALQNTYPTLTFMEQFNRAARRGELIK